MRQRALQAVFVAAFLLIAALIVHRGQSSVFRMPSAQAQDANVPPPPGGFPPPGNFPPPGGFPPPGAAFRQARPADRKAAIATIQAQLQAFKKDDFQKAAQYQSSGLRQRYGSAANFRDGIQHSYPAFIHFKAVTFGQARTPDQGRHLFLPVTLIETGGVQVRAFYTMVREASGYRVDGVDGGEAPPPGADGVPSQQT